MLENIVVSLTSLEHIKTSQLEDKWQKLEKSASTTFFLSWQWIKLLLKNRTNPFFLIEAKIADEIVGLGIFSYKKNIGFFRRSQLWLHRHGDKSKDQPWIEYNDFLLNQHNASEIRKCMVNYIHKQKVVSWDELYIGISLEDTVSDFKESGLLHRNLTESTTYLAQLNTEDTNYTDFLRRFSKNTRAQINRSIRLVEPDGLLELKMIEDTQEKISTFNRMSHWHISQWSKTKEGSGFNNPHFVNFHIALLADDIEKNQTEMAVLLQKGQPQGYIYNFIKQDTVYFYMSAIKRHPNKKINIGLIFHSMLMFHYSNNNKKNYDFLAGDAQYKKSLSDISDNMMFTCIYNLNLSIRFEHTLRELTNTLKLLYKRYILR